MGVSMDALAKVLEAQPNADFKAEEAEVKKVIEHGQRNKTYTTHYKMTETKITEVERVDSSEDEMTEQEHQASEKKKHKGCFANCFKKKKKG